MSDDLTGNILKQIRRRLGDRWDALSPADRDLIAEVAADASGLQLAALAVDPNDPAAVGALKREAAQVDAQLANVRSVAVGEVRGAFWQGFAAVGQMLVHVGLAAVGVSPAAIGVVADVVGTLAANPHAPAPTVITDVTPPSGGDPDIGPVEP